MKRETSLLQNMQHPPMPERDVPRTGLLSPPWRLLMQIGGDRQTTVGMEIADSIVIGRSDPQIDFHPELDLTSYGGQESGVSRRHVMITKGGKALYIKDLGSTNGTRINGFQLEADQLYRLRDGDELELGRVHITVRFVRSPY